MANTKPPRLTICICVFVDHEVSDEVGKSIARTAVAELERLALGAQNR